MFVRRVALLILTAMLCTQASAEITLKKNFFSGWKFSTDGIEYRKVGMSGSDLCYEMAGSEEALAHMKKYKTANTWAAITGIPGGFLVGWPLGGYIGSGGEWPESYTTMIVIGAPLSVISIICESSAGRNLKKAVGLYNEGKEPSLGLRLNLQPNEGGQYGTLHLALKYEF